MPPFTHLNFCEKNQTEILKIISLFNYFLIIFKTSLKETSNEKIFKNILLWMIRFLLGNLDRIVSIFLFIKSKSDQ